MKTRVLTALAACVVAIGISIPGDASAAATFQSCVGTDYDISGKVTPTTACTILTPLDGAQNDSPQPGFVNGAEFFGIDDWEFGGKWDSPAPGGSSWTDSSILFNFTGGGQTGTFTLVGALGDISDIMLVFKDGGDTNLVGYMLDLKKTIGGVYNSPFTEPPFVYPGTGPRDVSHISVYYREGGGIIIIPEPATLSLVGLSLLAVGAMSRRRKVRA